MREVPTFNPDEKKTSRTEEIQRLLAMYNRDLADDAEGTRTLSAEDKKNTEDEIERLEEELGKLN
ncbi:MAG TPA: hypothetical protein VLK22_01640 [Candidatus Udaeobacter sp.]|nr:hypothetical protein [Candidatus Udaeobacter sp.]